MIRYFSDFSKSISRRGGGAVAPTLVSAVIENAAPADVVLTHDRTVTGVVAGDYTIIGKTISNCVIADTVVTLTVSVAFAYGDIVTMSYAKHAGNVEDFTGQAVTNNVIYPIVLEDGNTVAWYLSDKTATITKDESDLVSEWADFLESGHDLLQATAGNKPLYTADGIYFVGLESQANGDWLKTAPFTLNQPTFIYAILKQIDWENNNRVWDGNGADSMDLMQYTTTPNTCLYAGAVLNNNTTILNKFQIIRAKYNGASSSLQFDELAKAEGNAGTSNAGGFTLGTIGSPTTAGYARINAKEIIIRKTADNEATESIIYNYLKRRLYPQFSEYNNVLVLGNSITVHPIWFYWWGEWGMAATIRENDFVHKLQSKIRTLNSGCIVEGVNIAAWEVDHTTYDLTNLDTYFETERDVVIIRLGENVVSEVNWEVSLQTLINYIESKTDAKIFITGVFFTDASKDVILASRALNNGFPYVELSSLNSGANLAGMGTIVYDEEGNPHAIDNEGVADHPSDIGMEAIAEKIFQLMVENP